MMLVNKVSIFPGQRFARVDKKLQRFVWAMRASMKKKFDIDLKRLALSLSQQIIK